jgi:hypothetical protein
VYRNPQPGLLLLDLETALSVSPHGSAGMSQCFDIPAASEVAEASLQESQHAEKPTRRRAEARTDIYEENSPPLIDRSEA